MPGALASFQVNLLNVLQVGIAPFLVFMQQRLSQLVLPLGTTCLIWLPCHQV